ncbi:SART-1 family protein DOT2 [Apium graveolens]|uniref:SART-1 family protein DOT2 n=1 Tax=Apium graveolens TaxID=4045 RepID=UPI003D7B4FEE
MDRDDSPVRERWEGGNDDLEDGVEVPRESSRHRSSKDVSKSSRRDEKSRHRSKDRERSKELEKERVSSRDRRKEGRDEHSKDRTREKARDKDGDFDKYRERDRERDRERKDHGKEKERERERESLKDSERGHDKERGKERSKDKDKDKEKEKDRDTRGKDREREKEREKYKGKEDREKEILDREKGKDRVRDKEREVNMDKERSREKDKANRKQRDEGHERSRDLVMDDKLRSEAEDAHIRDTTKQVNRADDTRNLKLDKVADNEPVASHTAGSDLKERISRMKEERLKKKSEGSSDILSWVNKSRKIEEKRNAEKERALQLSRVFEEQDNINQGDSDDEAAPEHISHDLSGVKVLHGLDKVIEGGAVVLTLKDQSILANGDVNEDVDMLENVEIGEQKQRDDAYKAAKRKPGTYEDKFSDDLGTEKKMLPQYDDPVADEGVTLDAAGRFSGEAKKKLDEIRRRIEGVSTTSHFEDLDSSAKTSSDYYTHEEMLRFKKPKKKKSLRKKDKLDLDALEAEAVSAGLGINDLGSRSNGKRQALREEQEKSEADKRSSAYQSAHARAEEASNALRPERRTSLQPVEEDEDAVFGDDDDDLRKSLERARKLALEKQVEAAPSGPQAIALLASSAATNSGADNDNTLSGEPQENKVVFTEMEEFVWGLQLGEEAHKPEGDDVFMEEDEAPKPSDGEKKAEDDGQTEMQDIDKDEIPSKEEDKAMDDTIHEAAVGKGLSGALNLLKDRGALKESVEWGGRNMDKKKSKLVGISDNDGKREIRIERTDEYGRILTPKEAFRLISHKFHGKGPGKMKQEKRMRQYEEELKVKKMKNSDTPSLSVERMREAQAQLKTPYLVLSGNVKPGQTSDPRSGFATVEKDLPGGLTPMLGDRKVEHFLGIKRKSEPGDMGPPKKHGDMGPPKRPTY